MKAKFTQNVMVFGCVSSKGDGIHWTGLKFNADDYVKLLEIGQDLDGEGSW